MKVKVILTNWLGEILELWLEPDLAVATVMEGPGCGHDIVSGKIEWGGMNAREWDMGALTLQKTTLPPDEDNFFDSLQEEI